MQSLADCLPLIFMHFFGTLRRFDIILTISTVYAAVAGPPKAAVSALRHPAPAAAPTLPTSCVAHGAGRGGLVTVMRTGGEVGGHHHVDGGPELIVA
jgi:hypothetical protein